MRLRFVGALYLAVVLSLTPSPASAQAAGGGTQASGTASIPRTSDGKPDLSGIWQVLNRANDNLLAHSASEGVPAGLGVVNGDEIPYRPEALQQKEENFANRETRDTEASCYLPGVPRITYMPFPFFLAYATAVLEQEPAVDDVLLTDDVTDRSWGGIIHVAGTLVGHYVSPGWGRCWPSSACDDLFLTLRWITRHVRSSRDQRRCRRGVREYGQQPSARLPQRERPAVCRHAASATNRQCRPLNCR